MGIFEEGLIPYDIRNKFIQEACYLPLAVFVFQIISDNPLRLGLIFAHRVIIHRDIAEWPVTGDNNSIIVYWVNVRVPAVDSAGIKTRVFIA